MADVDSEIVVREVATNVWIFSRPFNLFNRLPVGGRSTAVKLNNGVWILASTPLTPRTRQKLDELGEVKYIIAGNIFHHIFLKQYKDAFPNAKVIGPEDLNKKKEAEGWQLDAVFSASNPDIKHGFEDEIEHCYFSGYKNKDVAFYHRASRTAIAPDLLFNLPGTEQYATAKEQPPYFPTSILHSFSPYGWVMQAFLWTKTGDKAALQRDAQKVASWDFDKYIPCHGNVIESNANAAWKAAWKRFL